jgi:hypothetical protein
MKTIEMSKATLPVAGYMRGRTCQTLIFTKNGKPFAALTPIRKADLEMLTLSLGSNPEFLKMLEHSMRQIRGGKVLTMEEVCRKHGIRPPKRPRRGCSGKLRSRVP